MRRLTLLEFGRRTRPDKNGVATVPIKAQFGNRTFTIKGTIEPDALAAAGGLMSWVGGSGTLKVGFVWRKMGSRQHFVKDTTHAIRKAFYGTALTINQQLREDEERAERRRLRAAGLCPDCKRPNDQPTRFSCSVCWNKGTRFAKERQYEQQN